MLVNKIVVNPQWCDLLKTESHEDENLTENEQPEANQLFKNLQ